MSKREAMRELFDKADKITPMAEKDGQLFVNFDEAATLNSLNAFEGNGTGMQVRNPDGSLASTGKTIHAMNPDKFFENRYKKKNKTTMLVVSGHEPDGYRCITEQDSGRTHIKTIPCYEVVRTDDGELEVKRKVSVGESEFISDFTHRLTNASFAKLLPMITTFGTDLTADDMPI